MESANKTEIIVQSIVNVPVEIVWQLWTDPGHITQWNAASDDWHTPFAENDLRPGGRFVSRMAAKDGSFSFDFGGTYTEVKENELIAYTIDDGRKVKVTFVDNDTEAEVIETFEAEGENPVEMQREGWQAILNNFKKYAEAN